MTAEIFTVLCLPVHDQLYCRIFVKKQGQDRRRPRVDPKQLFHILRRGKAQPGASELMGEIFGVELTTREEVVPYGKKLQEMGAQNVLVSMAGEGAVLIAADGRVFDAPAPKGTLVNGVGAGDSMVAGFMAGWMQQQDYEHAFYMGLAAGSASAFSVNLATKEEVEAVYRQVARID